MSQDSCCKLTDEAMMLEPDKLSSVDDVPGRGLSYAPTRAEAVVGVSALALNKDSHPSRRAFVATMARCNRRMGEL